jgi:hypothetical protein
MDGVPTAPAFPGSAQFDLVRLFGLCASPNGRSVLADPFGVPHRPGGHSEVTTRSAVAPKFSQNFIGARFSNIGTFDR